MKRTQRSVQGMQRGLSEVELTPNSKRNYPYRQGYPWGTPPDGFTIDFRVTADVSSNDNYGTTDLKNGSIGALIYAGLMEPTLNETGAAPHVSNFLQYLRSCKSAHGIRDFLTGRTASEAIEYLFNIGKVEVYFDGLRSNYQEPNNKLAVNLVTYLNPRNETNIIHFQPNASVNIRIHFPKNDLITTDLPFSNGIAEPIPRVDAATFPYNFNINFDTHEGAWDVLNLTNLHVTAKGAGVQFNIFSNPNVGNGSICNFSFNGLLASINPDSIIIDKLTAEPSLLNYVPNLRGMPDKNINSNRIYILPFNQYRISAFHYGDNPVHTDSHLRNTYNFDYERYLTGFDNEGNEIFLPFFQNRAYLSSTQGWRYSLSGLIITDKLKTAITNSIIRYPNNQLAVLLNCLIMSESDRVGGNLTISIGKPLPDKSPEENNAEVRKLNIFNYAPPVLDTSNLYTLRPVTLSSNGSYVVHKTNYNNRIHVQYVGEKYITTDEGQFHYQVYTNMYNLIRCLDPEGNNIRNTLSIDSGDNDIIITITHGNLGYVRNFGNFFKRRYTTRVNNVAATSNNPAYSYNGTLVERTGYGPYKANLPLAENINTQVYPKSMIMVRGTPELFYAPRLKRMFVICSSHLSPALTPERNLGFLTLLSEDAYKLDDLETLVVFLDGDNTKADPLQGLTFPNTTQGEAERKLALMRLASCRPLYYPQQFMKRCPKLKLLAFLPNTEHYRNLFDQKKDIAVEELLAARPRNSSNQFYNYFTDANIPLMSEFPGDMFSPELTTEFRIIGMKYDATTLATKTNLPANVRTALLNFKSTNNL